MHEQEEGESDESAAALALPFLRRGPKEGLATQAERSALEASGGQSGRRGRRSAASAPQ